MQKQVRISFRAPKYRYLREISLTTVVSIQVYGISPTVHKLNLVLLFIDAGLKWWFK